MYASLTETILHSTFSLTKVFSLVEFAFVALHDPSSFASLKRMYVVNVEVSG